ncbi:protease modulator HflC [Parasphaerochaeta coccoides]|uniref:Protein HflC n=1 Tax=Parasphaerochaeta coccoides (strain ATCC BAA-1237 / DSM 17374 / SPN1) TaxID=760011 RepID=F4GLG3_PARC1|nr:protease modulator HflC [Parasphaerochaeta coccoides]AEC01933.1 HflC protein [Parasphaerochaeta coccoides DSM 17374]
MKKLITTLVIIAVLFIIILVLGPFYKIEEGEQAVVTRFGKIVDTQLTAGLKFKMPIIDEVLVYPKKILSWDGDAQRIPTKENQFIWVDTTARWTIKDPGKFYESVKYIPNGVSRLDDVLDSTIRTIISENYLVEAVRNTNDINSMRVQEQVQSLENVEDAERLRNLTVTNTQQERISIGREGLSQLMLKMAEPFMDAYGIELVDIVIRQIRYSDDLTQSVYQRMIKERNQIAEAYRSYGRGQLAMWQGKTENDRKNILSGAYASSEAIKGKADAQASRIYAEAYSVDADFFKLWRSLESYKKTVPALDKILSTDMAYFDIMYGPTIP